MEMDESEKKDGEKDEGVIILKWRQRDGYEFVLLEGDEEGTNRKIVTRSNGGKICVPFARLEQVDALQVIGLANFMVYQAGAHCAPGRADSDKVGLY